MTDSDVVEIPEYLKEFRGNRLVFIIPINDDELNILENLKLVQNGTWKVILYGYNQTGSEYIISDNISSRIMKKNEDNDEKYLLSWYYEKNSRYIKFECIIQRYNFLPLDIDKSNIQFIYDHMGFPITNDSIQMRLFNSTTLEEINFHNSFGSFPNFFGHDDSVHSFGSNYGFYQYGKNMSLIKKILNNKIYNNDVYVIIASFFFHDFFDVSGIQTMLGTGGTRRFLFIFKN